MDELCPVLRNAPVFVGFADHKARDVLEEQQRDVFLAAQFDKVCALQSAF